MTDIASIIKENEIRQSVFSKKYDPFTGEGSLIERQKVEIAELGELYLPYNMLNDSKLSIMLAETGNVKDLAKILHTTTTQVISKFTRERYIYDFEFWSAWNIKIQDKLTLQETQLILRLAQRYLLVELEKMRLAGVPIRIVLLKARQWGGSTLVQMYMFWIQQIHKRNWHLAVCAQDDGAAGNISQMYHRAAEFYPAETGVVTFKPYAKSQKSVICKETGGIIGVGSINNPEQFRSYNYPMAHLSEVGVWKDTPQRTAASLVQSLRSQIPQQPYTFVAIESTAKGIGSFFHKEWLAARDGRSGYKAVFVPWHKIDIYRQPIENYERFISSFSEYDWFLWDQGATLEGINWYSNFKRAENYDDWQMFNEYPTTAEEAFISSGQRYFSPKIIEPQKVNITKPVFVGSVHPSRPTGKSDIEQSHFVPSVRGNIKIWKMPRPIVEVKGEKFRVVNRYCGFGDIGGTSKNADYSSFTIMDRFQMLYGGWPEIALDWHGHLDQDLFAWEAAQICFLYDKCLLALEANSLKKEKADSEGDHFFTVLDTIKDHYDNLYIRNQVDNVMKDWVPKYGFWTGHGSKDMILSTLRAGLREGQYTERDFEALQEYEYFEVKTDGELGAIDGEHDDRVISRAGAYWLATKYMSPVKLIPYLTDDEKRKNRKGRGGVLTEATI